MLETADISYIILDGIMMEIAHQEIKSQATEKAIQTQ